MDPQDVVALLQRALRETSAGTLRWRTLRSSTRFNYHKAIIGSLGLTFYSRRSIELSLADQKPFRWNLGMIPWGGKRTAYNLVKQIFGILERRRQSAISLERKHTEDSITGALRAIRVQESNAN